MLGVALVWENFWHQVNIDYHSKSLTEVGLACVWVKGRSGEQAEFSVWFDDFPENIK